MVAGPTGDYIQPAVDAIKKYVEDGGRALFMLDPPLKVGRKEIGDNDALLDLLASWGVTVDKDLILDENPVSQLVGLGPEVPLVTTYESHPIVNDLAGTATGFPDLPVARNEERRQDHGHQAVLHLRATASPPPTLNSPEIRIDPNKDKKGPFTLAAAGTYNTGKAEQPGPLRGGRQFPLGRQHFPPLQRQPRTCC